MRLPRLLQLMIGMQRQDKQRQEMQAAGLNRQVLMIGVPQQPMPVLLLEVGEQLVVSAAQT